MVPVSHLDYIGLIRMNLPGKGRSIMRISKDVWSRPRIMIYLCLLPVYWLADYHLGGFRALPKDKFKIQQSNPYVTSTRCHMLAMYVVLESYLGMICDTPEAYEGQPGFEFLQTVPTTWDKTVVPDASVNEYVAIARRHGDDWYVGAINNSQARNVEIALDFLGKGDYKVTLYKDARDTDTNPNHLIKDTLTVTAKDKITVPLASDGGAAMHIQPVSF